MERTVLDELKRRVSYMTALGFRDAPPRFSSLLSWLESEPATNKIISRLGRDVNIETLMATAGPHQPPSLGTPEDVARMGLFIFEYCRETPDNLPGLLFSIGCWASYGDLNDHFSLALKKYINPFLAYLQEELRDVPTSISIDAVAEVRRGAILNAEFERLYPQASRLLHNMSKEMSVFVESENWFNVANSCRHTFQEFASELLSVLKLQRPETIKADDARGIIGYALSVIMTDSRSSEALKSLMKSAWDYASSLLHRNTATRSEAIRAYLWTGMVVSEIFEQTKNVKQSQPVYSAVNDRVTDAEIPHQA